MKRYQRGDAGAAMLAVMLIMVLGFGWWGGMHGGGRAGHMPGDAHTTVQEKTVIEQLDDAYAQGKIGREEYLQKRDDLLRR